MRHLLYVYCTKWRKKLFKKGEKLTAAGSFEIVTQQSGWDMLSGFETHPVNFRETTEPNFLSVDHAVKILHRD